MNVFEEQPHSVVDFDELCCQNETQRTVLVPNCHQCFSTVLFELRRSFEKLSMYY